MTDNERLFRIIWPDRCWHIPGDPDEQDGWKGMRWCRICKAICSTLPQEQVNPDFAHSDEIAQAMMDAGLWEEFVEWHGNNSCAIYSKADFDTRWDDASEIDFLSGIEILMTPSLLKQAIIAWWEGK